MIIFLHHAGGREEIVFRQRVAHVRQAEAGGLQFQRVHDDVKFRRVAAGDFHARHAGNLEEARLQFVIRRLPQAT